MNNFLANWAKKYEVQRNKLVEQYGEKFDQPSGSTFGLNHAEVQCISNWLESLKPEILASQKKMRESPELGGILQDDEPYYGATGGGVTYSFIPTSLGTILVVKESITGKELNVSDALEWYFYG